MQQKCIMQSMSTPNVALLDNNNIYNSNKTSLSAIS